MAERDDTGVESVTEQALAFVEEIREAYDLGMHEFVSVQELLLHLAERGQMPSSLLSLQGYLRPILCSNPREQEEFSERLADFLRRRSPSLPRLAPDALRVDDWQGLRRNNLGASAALAVVLGLIALAVVVAWRASEKWTAHPQPTPSATTTAAPKPTTPVVAPPPSGDVTGTSTVPRGGAPADTTGEARAGSGTSLPVWLTLLLVASALGAFVGHARWARRRARTLLAIEPGLDRVRESPATPPAMAHGAETIFLEVRSPPLLNPSEVKKATSALRARKPGVTTELDLPRTMEATARNAGLVIEVRRELTEIPEYLFLVERRHPNDFECARHDELLDALVTSGVHLRRLYFDGSANVVFARGETERPRPFGELRSGFRSHRVGVFADPESLLEPATLELSPWVKDLLGWAKPMVLTSGNRDAELPAVQRLRAAGITIVADSARGLAEALGRPLPRMNDDADDGYVPTEPRALRSDTRHWLSAEPPAEEEIARCLSQLQDHLGTAGYYWFAACALYPQLRWPLAVQVARALELLPFAADAETARRLTRLPWMRAGRMPPWLRRRLLVELSPDEREAVRRAVEQVLVLGATGQSSSTKLSVFRKEPAIVRGAYRELSRLWRRQPDLPSPLEDAVFASEMPEHAAQRVPLAIRSIGSAIERQKRIELPPRDALQCAFGGLLLSYLLQLGLTLLPVNQSLAAGAGALIALGLTYGAIPSHLLEKARADQTSVRLVSARALVIFGTLSGALLGRVDFSFNDSPTGLDNVNMAVMLLMVLGAPLAIFDRPRSRATAVALVASGLVAYKILHPVHAWTVHTANRRELTATTTLFIFGCHAVFSVVIGVLGDIFAQQLTRGFGERLRRLHDSLDRFATDRLLFDRAGTRSLPASRLRTALGAAVLGSVFGAMTTVVWSETVVWARLFLIAAGVAVVAYPQVATRRHRQREGQHAELRAGYESALVVVGTLVGTRGEPAEVAWLGIALVIASWISCWSAHPNGSVRMREFIERVAPDRLLGTKPAFLGVAYLQLFLSALAQFLAPVWETSTGLTPDLTPGTGGTIPIAASGGDANTPNTGGVPAGAGGEVARGGASGTMATSGATAAGGATGAGGAVNTGGNPTKKDQVKKPRNTGGAMNSATGGVPGTAAGANGGVPSTFAGGGAPSTAAGGVPVTATGGVPGSKPGREAMGGEATSMKAEAVRVACLSKCAEEERRCIASCGATGESSLDDYGVELDVGTTVQSLCEPRCARASQLCAEACESTSIKP